MEFYEPRTDLYKKVTEPQKLRIFVDVRVRAGKKVTKSPTTDPKVGTTKTYLRFDIGDDATKTAEYYDHFDEEFTWSGESHEVETVINGGGTSVNSSDKAEPY